MKQSLKQAVAELAPSNRGYLIVSPQVVEQHVGNGVIDIVVIGEALEEPVLSDLLPTHQAAFKLLRTVQASYKRPLRIVPVNQPMAR